MFAGVKANIRRLSNDSVVMGSDFSVLPGHPNLRSCLVITNTLIYLHLLHKDYYHGRGMNSPRGQGIPFVLVTKVGL